uniref:Dynein light chain n=1 Tax=Chromera velia CCMP2878 TaxID=1169474 RepID=A0A0G4HWC9_9ALVE|mmetsp:Transcript_4324/g.8760  ORF Transcript_4324/g.8760 Transcript_4324/m.8760 type:complete len:93 (-) Transcript_4324:136-414(-)|eukprot:Cvel_9002.t1-p1 / transcript=Cvel_9002.t1 / gene=Cvel_9002 / organism=Chromera_velia_CCMP2878 / gene_product=Dynein light chain LC6, flagellar outer arm, putative / transcript_product=Dynein light chain LC6, flagellar outer arm, putative / location=Cvel_scaffold509:55325-57971(-) / protein_length=92 / sequence_SO=supercontig / SO=protein_coding / is_pseudo=false
MAENKYQKVVIKNQEMPDDLVKDVSEQAKQAFETCKCERDIADQLKEYLDKNHSPTWNVIVGAQFGSYVTHETKCYLYFSVANLSLLVWKCG